MITAELKVSVMILLMELTSRVVQALYGKSILAVSGSLIQSRDILRLLIFVKESSALELFEARDSMKGPINLPSRMAS